MTVAKNKQTKALASTQTADDSVAAPSGGEKSGIQSRGGTLGIGLVDGFGKPPVGTFDLYRKMRLNPTLALARVVDNSPVKAADWGYESSENAPNDALDFIKAVMKPLLRGIVKDCLRSRDYGFTAFEKVWAIEDVNGRLAITLKKLKSLLVDITTPRVDKEDGGFAGIKNGKTELEPVDSFWFTYDGEPGNEWFGLSKFETVRRSGVWTAWDTTLKKLGNYLGLAAGPLPLIQYPLGKSLDADGNEVDNFEIAKTILQNIQKGKGIIAPNELVKYATEFLNRGVDMSKLQAWRFDFMETKGQHGKEFVGAMEYFDKLLLRGRLVPERAAIEGQHGTKAESQEHAGIVLTGAEDFLEDLEDCINRFIIDPLLIFNFGADAKGSVTINHAPLVDEKLVLIREMVTTVLTNPANTQLFLDVFDLDSALQQMGLPKAADLTKAIENRRLNPPAQDMPDSELTPTVLSIFSGRNEWVRALGK